ncbi:MAG: methyltransferase domain-containing protein [Asgard group archaeon]|nr:methyltransferase domain-containing protein [Asgard group archaeon]
MLKDSVSNTIRDIVDKFQFNFELVNRLIFYYGVNKATNIIQSLRTYQSTYPIRVNTQITTSEELLETLNTKKIPAKKHPILEDCILISVEGPLDIKQKSKTVTVNYNRSVHNVLIGASLGSKDFIADTDDLNIGEEITIKNKTGELLANGILMMGLREIEERKKGIAIKVIESKYQIPNLKILKEYLRGHFIHQSVPSLILSSSIKLKRQDRLLDMNIGQGEILTHVWQNNKSVPSRIIGIESSIKQAERFQENIKRLRMSKANFETHQISFNKFTEKFNKNETFDWIILSLPSSNLGIRPKVYGNIAEKIILKNANQQQKYLQHVAKLLKPNGTILYQTNSLDPAENEMNIQYAVEELNLKIEKLDYSLGSNCVKGFQGAEHLQYFFPDVHDTNGEFIAKLTK